MSAAGADNDNANPNNIIFTACFHNIIFTTGYLLDYDYIKNHYKLIAVDLSRQKDLDADSKAIQQLEFVGQLKKYRWCKC